MQVALPLTALILAVALCWDRREARKSAAASEQRAKDVASSKEVTAWMESLTKDFDDYKKRVDALTLRAGFKL